MTDEPAPRPLVEGIFTPEGADGLTHLLTSRCACGAVAFPPRVRCAACSGTELTVTEAPNEGAIYSWTTGPGETPRVVAQVVFEGGLMVQGYVTAPPADVRIGQRVRTEAVPAGWADDGTPVLSYAFAPVEGGD